DAFRLAPGEGAFELGKFSATRHLHLQLTAVAADDRTVGIRLIEGVQQATPPSASSTAGPDIAATLAGGRHPARLSKWIGIRDVGTDVEQKIERRAAAWPINARLHRRTRRHPYRC